MLHSRCNNNKIKYLHERCLQLIYNDKPSSYQELLQKGGSVSIHQENTEELVTEIFKVKQALAAELEKNIFLWNQIKITIIFYTKVISDNF